MKTYVKLIFGLSIFLLLGGFFLIYSGIILLERSIVSWGILSLLLAFISFIVGETENHKPPQDKNPYSL